jgi:hypothetical protein
MPLTSTPRNMTRPRRSTKASQLHPELLLKLHLKAEAKLCMNLGKEHMFGLTTRPSVHDIKGL